MDSFSLTDRILLGLNVGLGTYDWNETRRNVTLKGSKEYNPALSDKPPPDEVNRYFAGLGGLGIAGVAALPEEWRSPVLIGAAALQHANLKGSFFGNPDMTKPGDKNSIPLALGAAAATYGLSGLIGRDNPNRTVSITPTENRGLMLGVTQKFGGGGVVRRRTQLTPEGEARFQREYRATAERVGINPNPDDPGHNYDYRGAWKEGSGPGSDQHWPSRFKDDDHPNRFVKTDQGLLDSKNNRIVLPNVEGEQKFSRGGSVRRGFGRIGMPTVTTSYHRPTGFRRIRRAE